jgi:hypothetical protein
LGEISMMLKIIFALNFFALSLGSLTFYTNAAHAHGGSSRGQWDCSFTNEFHKTYYGTGTSQEDAIAMARGHCMGEYSSIFCDKTPNCSYTSPRERTHWECVVTSDFNKTYYGHGNSEVQAEAMAKKRCSQDVNGMFCEKVTCNSYED